MASYIWLIPTLLLCSSVYGGKTDNGCLVYDFESDLEEFKDDAFICEPFPLWTIRNYSETEVSSPNSNSESFISPASALSCISSTTFRAFGGVVEINVYMDGRSPSDVVSALLMKTVSDGNDLTVATAMVSPSQSDANGWHILKLDVLDHLGDFEAYITFIGTKSDESIFLIDSFRYVPQTIDVSSCMIYEDEIDQATTPTPNEDDDECMTYNFEKDFDVLFSPDNYLCDEFLSWKWHNYTELDVESPNVKSSLFISPSETLSCVSSFVFTMEPKGVIEANVYMEPNSDLDNIIVIAQKVTSGNVDTVAGSEMYYPKTKMFVTGWNVLSFTVQDFTSFEGYLILLGSATEGSIVLIDSVRYIPPSVSSSNEHCAIY